MTDTVTDPKVTGPALDDSDPIRTHIIGPKDGVNGPELLMKARVFGTPVTALCGFLYA